MRHSVTTFLAAGLVSSALALAQGNPAAGPSIPLTPDVEQRSFTVTGTLVRPAPVPSSCGSTTTATGSGFSLGPRVSPADLRAGSRVSVRYRPTGSTGQVADEVEVLAGPRGTGAR